MIFYEEKIQARKRLNFFRVGRLFWQHFSYINNMNKSPIDVDFLEKIKILENSSTFFHQNLARKNYAYDRSLGFGNKSKTSNNVYFFKKHKIRMIPARGPQTDNELAKRITGQVPIIWAPVWQTSHWQLG